MNHLRECQNEGTRKMYVIIKLHFRAPRSLKSQFRVRLTSVGMWLSPATFHCVSAVDEVDKELHLITVIVL